MCGVFGFIGPEPDRATIIDLARKAGRRGPHACGWANKLNGVYQIERRIGALGGWAENIVMGSIIIGHSRLATTGGQSYRNVSDAQPLTIPGSKSRSDHAFVHNGVVGFDKWPEQLDTRNDSEVLLRYILRDGFAAAIPLSEPYVMMWAKDSELVVARKGLPLFVRDDARGSYFCSITFDGARPLMENRLCTHRLKEEAHGIN